MYNSSDPVYKQVQEILQDRIKKGVWPLHSKIPDEISLSRSLNISRGTLRKAIKALIEAGILTQIRGKGTFVVSSHIEQQLASRLVSFSEAMHEQGLNYKTMVFKKEVIRPDVRIAALLELEPKMKVVYMERVRLVDNVPIIYLKNYVPWHYCKGLIDDDLENIALFSLIEGKYGHHIEWGRRYFRAVPALGDVIRNLGVEVAKPVMYLEQITYTNESVPIECSNVWINSDRFDIISILKR
jgi:GntR family transcriptional regulator